MAASTGESTLAGFSRPTLGVAAIAGAHIVALGVFPASPSLTSIVLLEAVTLVAILAVTFTTNTRRETATIAVLFAIATAGTWALVSTGPSVLVSALALVSTLLLVGYGLHRFELVTLGLVEVDDE